MISKMLILAVLKLRWAYFHANPNYIKFSIDSKSESYFQHKSGSLHCNLTWDDCDG